MNARCFDDMKKTKMLIIRGETTLIIFISLENKTFFKILEKYVRCYLISLFVMDTLYTYLLIYTQ